MKFSLSKLRFRNPSSNGALQNDIPDGVVHGGGDNFMTAETSSECNVRGGDDDNDNSSSGGSYPDAGVRAPVSDVHPASSSAVVATVGTRNPVTPPVDDCCPICFSAFVVPCRAPCGHWYCGGCILKYWYYSTGIALQAQPCSCPMCLLKITSLTPEASLLQQQQEADVTRVLEQVQEYNRLFVGGIYGFFRRVAESSLVLQSVHIHVIRMMIAIVIGLLYSISPFDFLHIDRKYAAAVFECCASAFVVILNLVGFYLWRRRLQLVRGMDAIQL